MKRTQKELLQDAQRNLAVLSVALEDIKKEKARMKEALDNEKDKALRLARENRELSNRIDKADFLILGMFSGLDAMLKDLQP